VITDFGIAKVIGGQFNVLATDIYKQVIGQQNFEMGAVVGFVLLIPAVFAFAADRIIARRQVALLSARSVPLIPKAVPRRDWTLFAFCAVVGGLILSVLLMAVWASLVTRWPYNLALTLKNYSFAEFDSNGWGAYWNSLVLASWTAVIGTAVVFLGAYLLEKTRGLDSWRPFVRLMAVLPMGVPGMVLGLMCYLMSEPPRGQAEADRASVSPPPGLRVVLPDIFRTPTAAALLLVFAGANAIASVFLFWTPMFLKEKFHFELAAAGLSGAVYIHLASALAMPLAGLTADRLARRMPGGRMLAQSAGLLIGAGFIVLVGTTNAVSTLIVAMICFGLCKGFYDAGIFASLYDVIHPRSRASAAGIMNTVGWIGGALATKLTGWYADNGPHGSPVLNMSRSIAYGGAVYLAGAAVLLATALLFAKRDVVKDWGPRPVRPGPP
jgi:ABC-type spermidine/putrescine transport system permease subunit II